MYAYVWCVHICMDLCVCVHVCACTDLLTLSVKFTTHRDLRHRLHAQPLDTENHYTETYCITTQILDLQLHLFNVLPGPEIEAKNPWSLLRSQSRCAFRQALSREAPTPKLLKGQDVLHQCTKGSLLRMKRSCRVSGVKLQSRRGGRFRASPIITPS